MQIKWQQQHTKKENIDFWHWVEYVYLLQIYLKHILPLISFRPNWIEWMDGMDLALIIYTHRSSFQLKLIFHSFKYFEIVPIFRFSPCHVETNAQHYISECGSLQSSIEYQAIGM